MKKADLHLHSNYSDGSDSPKELVEKVKKNELSAFALTDHDTIAGCIEIKKYLPKDIKFIAGTELTCLADTVKCHILGYNCVPSVCNSEKSSSGWLEIGPLRANCYKLTKSLRK